jgi:hypothetical protein
MNREAFTWKHLHHQHVLPFLGIDVDTFPGHQCMVTLWMSNGTVMDYLKHMPNPNVVELVRSRARFD